MYEITPGTEGKLTFKGVHPLAGIIVNEVNVFGKICMVLKDVSLQPTLFVTTNVIVFVISKNVLLV